MKLVSLNTWGGKVYQSIIDFVVQHSFNTDIFCFQEIYDTKSSVKQYKDIRANLLKELKQILPDFQVCFTPEFTGFDASPDPVDFDLTVGEAIFIAKDIKIHSFQELPISGDKSEKILKPDFSNLPVTLQSVDFAAGSQQFTVCNFHGTSFPGTKLDTKKRIEQSGKVKNFLSSKGGAKILAGDFNLLPCTQSIKMLEEDMRNLIKEFNIEKTRSRLSPYSDKPDFQKFADYIFVSPDIKVVTFQVPNIQISDHLPIILEFA